MSMTYCIAVSIEVASNHMTDGIPRIRQTREHFGDTHRFHLLDSSGTPTQFGPTPCFPGHPCTGTFDAALRSSNAGPTDSCRPGQRDQETAHEYFSIAGR